MLGLFPYYNGRKTLTKGAELLLVALATSQTLFLCVSILNGLLDSHEPAVTVGGRLGLEGVLVAVELE